MFPYRIVAEWSEADACYVARVPAFPNCAAHGDTLAEAASEAQQAAEMMAAVLGAKAPPSDLTATYSGKLQLRMPPSLHAALALRAATEHVSLNAVLLTILAEAATPMTREALRNAVRTQMPNAAAVAAVRKAPRLPKKPAKAAPREREKARRGERI